VEDLKNIGHSLARAWREAVNRGFSRDSSVPAWIKKLDTLHDKPHYLARYPHDTSGIVRDRPSIIESQLDELIEKVAKAVGYSGSLRK